MKSSTDHIIKTPYEKMEEVQDSILEGANSMCRMLDNELDNLCKEKKEGLNIEPLLQLMEAQNEYNAECSGLIAEQQAYIDKLEKRLDRDRLVKSEKRMMIVMVALSVSVLFSTLFNLL